MTQYSFSDFTLPEATIRLSINEGSPLYGKDPIDSPSAAVRAMSSFLRELDREHLCVINCSSGMAPTSYNIVSIGTINSTVADASNIFKTAILSNAANIILMHNHPSGNPKPSANDRAVTAKMVVASQLLGIAVMDHIIVGGMTGEMYSFAENKEPSLGIHPNDIEYVCELLNLKEPLPFAEERRVSPRL